MASFVGAAAVLAAFEFEFEFEPALVLAATALFTVVFEPGWQAVAAKATSATTIKYFVLFI
jgi:hypothetical protein